MVCLADEALFSLPSTHPMVCADLDRLRHIDVRRPWSSESIDNCPLQFLSKLFFVFFVLSIFIPTKRPNRFSWICRSPTKKKKKKMI